MILVLLGLSLVILVGGIILSACYDSDGGFVCSFCFGGFAFLTSLVTMLILIFDVSTLAVIDDKIVMYQEENARIEEQISATVEQYQKYETEIFTEAKPESSITLVALYPDLKSDTLVQTQLEVYTENNKKIKELREEQISGSVKRWWLYFGG